MVNIVNAEKVVSVMSVGDVVSRVFKIVSVDYVLRGEIITCRVMVHLTMDDAFGMTAAQQNEYAIRAALNSLIGAGVAPPCIVAASVNLC